MDETNTDTNDSLALEVPRDLHDAMVAHCLREAPRECCGILAGRAPRVAMFLPLRNVAAGATRYFADPRQLIEVDKTLRQCQANILAIYHSHPECAALPSRVDLEENYYGSVPRIIVSLRGGTPEVRVWRLDPDSYQELAWHLVEPTEPSQRLEVARALPGALDYRPVGIITRPGKSWSSMQQTLILFKPDCVQRRLVGAILQRFEAKGLRIAALKLIRVDRGWAEKHYAEHRGKPFFEGLIGFITSAPVIVGVLEGNEAIAVVRNLLGATNGVAAAPGTVRGDFAISQQNNLVHGSDSPESARREIALWFRPEELVDYAIAGDDWVSAGA